MSPEEERNKVDAWGRVLIRSDDLIDLLYNEYDIKDLNIVNDSNIDEYNKWCKEFKKTDHYIISVEQPNETPEEEHKKRSSEWFIPDAYKKIDVRLSLLDRCQTEEEFNRVNMEMDMFEKRDLIPLLQLMFYLVDHFRKKNIVWGVGRGSSCASYCLFLIGVHKIDALKYDLDIKEFLKD